MNKLYKLFVGELVSITMTLYIVEGNSKESFQVPYTRNGYLLDQDKYHFYFGKTPDSVSFSIRRTLIAGFDLVENEPIVELPRDVH